ncbi:MAG: sigma-54-dependent transcriptional regulator [Alphaproteobacteria bacterium]
MAQEVLIVDDEVDIRELVSGILEDEGFATRTASDADTALAALNARMPSLMVLDIWLKGSRLDGLELLEEVKAEWPDLPVVIISGHGNIETAVAAIKKGAYDFVEKPFQADRLILLIERAIEANRLRAEIADLKRRGDHIGELIGESTAVAELRAAIDRIGPTNSRVLITGAAGSGKEVVARAIHAASPRENGPFIVINAATLAPERVEEELFGIEGEPGASRRVGVFERAHGGTLYIDEVSEMPRETQSKVLRVLVDQKFTRLGGDTVVEVDVRVISSSSIDLPGAIQNGLFREDLYHRLNVVPLTVPRLAARREDIPMLVEHFMHRAADGMGVGAKPLSEHNLAVLQAHSWPGNVRQLRNIVERLLIHGTDDVAAVLASDMLSAEPTGGRIAIAEELLALPLREARESFEREYLQSQMERFRGNVSRTAGFVGMERSALHRKLKSLGLGGDRNKLDDEAATDESAA